MSIGAHIPTEVTAPIIISNTFKNICALSLGINIPIEATLEKIKSQEQEN